MHKSAQDNLTRFINEFGVDGKVLDVGSLDINGSAHKSLNKIRAKYYGLDLIAGDNVTHVWDTIRMPFEDNYFDQVISISTFEHDRTFWITFQEMVRVVKPGRYIFLCVPSTGCYHGYPSDCWRFRADAMEALSEWGKVKIVKSYVDNSNPDWNDCVGIFQK